MLERMVDPVTIERRVSYPGAWLSWVAATTGCLQSLGLERDLADVAGMSGYAFHLCVHRELCPSGPTVFPWGQLDVGVRYLGRSVQRFYSGECPTVAPEDRYEAHCWYAFKAVRREVEANRPSVLWGAYVPEFAIVRGVQGESYLVESFRALRGEAQPPIAYNDLDTPGGTYVLSFPTHTEFQQDAADQHAVRNAVAMFERPSYNGAYRWGADAYDEWIAALEERRAAVWGNSYNTQCYAEGRRLAHTFLERLVGRHPSHSEPLMPAVEGYAAAAAAFERLAEIFPFTMDDEAEVVDDGATIQEAVEALGEAREAEVAAIDALKRSMAESWADTA